MKIDDTINELINLPRQFNSVDNKSIRILLKETGYFEIHNQISVEKIRDVLIHHPDRVDDWIAYSEDKRSSFGWYFKYEANKNKYIVDSFSGKEEDSPHGEYSNRLDACAYFIKNEIDDIRTC